MEKRMKWYWYLIVTLFVFWFLAIATPISIGKYRGESMVPVFKNGELLVLLKAKPAGIKIKKGMIVGYKDGKEKESIIHRVISVQEGKIITQGDNNPEPDKTISDSDVIGVYLFKIPFFALGIYSYYLRCILAIFYDFSFPMFFKKCWASYYCS